MLGKPALMTYTKQKVTKLDGGAQKTSPDDGVSMGTFQRQLSVQEGRRNAKVQAGIIQKCTDDNRKCHYVNKNPEDRHSLHI